MAVQRTVSSRIGVMGMPGVGKSTFLNCALYQSDAGKNGDLDEALEFATAASGESCTQVVREQTVTYEEGMHRVTFVDTMGWPDPDRSKAADMYDDVVRDAINHSKGLNCLVWVVSSGRKNHDIYKTYKAFMKEMRQASCPILMVVNGTENFSADRKRFAKNNPAKLEKIISDARDEISVAVREMLTILEFEESSIKLFIAVDKDELEDNAVPWMIQLARGLECAKSNVRLFSQMKDDFKDAAKAMESHQKDLMGQLERSQQGIDAELSRREIAVASGGTLGAAGGAALSWWLVGGILTGGWGWVVGGAAILVTAGAAAAGGSMAGVEHLSDENLKKLRATLEDRKTELESGEHMERLQAEAVNRAEDVRLLSEYLEPDFEVKVPEKLSASLVTGAADGPAPEAPQV